jgi:intracellular septation protein
MNGRALLGKREVLAGTHDLSCTLLFAVTYLVAPFLHQNPLFAATAVYVIANAFAFAVSRNFEEGMLLVAWVSRLTIVVMGTLTRWLHDPTFIKMNRTFYFGLLAIWSVGSVLIGPPRLQRFSARESLRSVTFRGWRRLTLFAACASLLMAALNEIVWRYTSTGFWVAFQVWGWILAEIIILPLSMPILTRHGAVYKKPTADASGAVV